MEGTGTSSETATEIVDLVSSTQAEDWRKSLQIEGVPFELPEHPAVAHTVQTTLFSSVEPLLQISMEFFPEPNVAYFLLHS